MPKAAREPAPRRNVVINLRAPEQLRDLVDRAAEASGKTRTEFMLEAARERAENALLDRRVFVLDEAKFEAFRRALDNPAPPNAKLRELFRKPLPWRR
jgi:uncharacterized protein (DUF1778 family)